MLRGAISLALAGCFARSNCNLTPPLARWLCRKAGVITWHRDVLRDARICGEAHARAHFHVVGDGAPASHDAVVAELRRTGEPSISPA